MRESRVLRACESKNGGGDSEILRSLGQEKRTENNVILSVRDVIVEFGGFRAVDGVSFDIREGSVVAIVGPNGAGKSTLFNGILGSQRISRGSIVFRGKDVTGLAPYKIARMGLVRTFQRSRVFPRMTCLDNVMVSSLGHPGERLSGLLLQRRRCQKRERELRRKAEELLDVVGLSGLRDRYAGDLSGGQRKLLEFSRCLMMDPTVVCLDEPLAGVNPSLAESLMITIKKLHSERGLTVLFVEHNLGLVERFSEEVIVLAEGRVIGREEGGRVFGLDVVRRAYLGDQGRVQGVGSSGVGAQ